MAGNFKVCCGLCGSANVVIDLVSEPYWDDGIFVSCTQCKNVNVLIEEVIPFRPATLFEGAKP